MSYNKIIRIYIQRHLLEYPYIQIFRIEILEQTYNRSMQFLTNAIMNTKILTSSELTYHESSASGKDALDVQFRSTTSPTEYLDF